MSARKSTNRKARATQGTALPPDGPQASDLGYRTLFESTPYPSLVFDRKTLRFLEVNAAAQRFYGWSREEFLGMTARDIRPPEEVPLLLGKLAEKPVEETRFIGAVRHWNKQRAILEVEVTVSMVEFHGREACIAVIHDVSGGKREEQLIASERSLLRTLVDLLPDCIYLKDPDCRFLLANDAVAQVMGASSAAELIGRTDADYYPPELAASLREDELRVFRSGQPVINKDESRHAGKGGIRHLLTSKVPLKDDQGNTIALVGIGRDITERKQVEEALRESELKYRTLYETLHDAFVAVDMDGRILEFNAAYRKLLGYRANELRALTYEEITPAEWHAMEARVVSEQVLEKGYSDVYEKEYRRKNGKLIPVELRTFLIRDAEGRPSQLWAIVRDITGRKRMEAELKQLNSTLERRVAERTAQLREREERLHAVLKTVGDAILSIDHHGRIFGVNPATERIFGYSEAELLGWNAAMLVPAGFGSELDGGITDLLVAEDVRILGTTREMQGLRKDGRIFPVDLTLSEVDDTRVYTCVIRDITRRKELEVEVLRITEAERYRVAADLHDGICQELVGIAFMLTAVRRDLEKNDPLSHKLRLIAQSISDAADHTRQVARGMSPVVADGGGLMHALRQLATTTARSRRVRCRFECPVPVSFEGPLIANELYRIAQEAIHNAIRHAEARQITIRLGEQDGEVCLTILDNGHGCAGISHGIPGMGLRVMRYRASLISAELTIQPRKRGGTEVLCCVRKTAGCS
jgi:PAS domain S-box-containing protein